MKNLSKIIICFFIFNTILSQKIPSVNIKTLEGKTINTSTFENNGNPIIISFWALWCKNCIKELEAITQVVMYKIPITLTDKYLT